MVEVKDYGKDHWSLLAYLETLIVDGGIDSMTGKIDAVKMRCNIGTNGHLAEFRQTRPWKKEWGTRLAGYFKDGDERDETRRLDDHDDWDCLEDLEEAGFIEILSLANFFFKMENKGMKVAAQIRSHKAGGGTFATFKPNNSQGETK